MFYLNATPMAGGKILWQNWKSPYSREGDGLRIAFHIHSGSRKLQRYEATQTLKRILQKDPVSWFSPAPGKSWSIDCDVMKTEFNLAEELSWLSGKFLLEGDWEDEVKDTSGILQHKSSLFFYITPETIEESSLMSSPAVIPPEISESLKRFAADHPDPRKAAFIMMKFGATSAHEAITTAIRDALGAHGIAGLRADDKEYHDDLFSNIRTYIYGCGIGIAVFERLESNDFNPNVSLEVGYMMAQGKHVCLLKDRTLQSLHTDLVGKLYRTFDPQHPAGDITKELQRWLSDKGLDK